MQIHVKLYSDLKQYTPGEMGQLDLTLPPGANLGSVFERLAIPQDRNHIALINGRRAFRESVLSQGDTLVVFPQICGG